MNLRDDSRVQHFVNIARLFCQYVETPSEEKEFWIRNILVVLAQLYAAVFSLPEVELFDDDCIPENNFDVDDVEWKQVFMNVVQILGQIRWYRMNYDWMNNVSDGPNDNEVVEVGDLADDLADIYRDIKPGLRAWDENRDEYLPEIVWGWRETLFTSHWGIHAVNALRVLHPLVFLRGLGA